MIITQRYIFLENKVTSEWAPRLGIERTCNDSSTLFPSFGQCLLTVPDCHLKPGKTYIRGSLQPGLWQTGFDFPCAES